MPNRIKAAKLLLNNFFPKKQDRIKIDRVCIEDGISFDLFTPLKKPIKTFIMVYGLDYAGEKDPRLIKFAKAFALNGFRVLIPELPGLKSLEIRYSDIEILHNVAKYIKKNYGDPIGITAFSVGGGLALITAAKAAPLIQIDPILLFSPHYTIMELWEKWQSEDVPAPTNEREMDHYLWNQMALAYRGLDSLALTKTEREKFLSMLFNFCSEASLEIKQKDFDSIFADKEIPRYGDFPLPREDQEALSPQGKLSGISGRVLLLHDTNDLIIPPSHSIRIMKELRESGSKNAHCHRMMITPLLSHVTVSNTWRVMDVLPILDIIGEIFSP